MRDMSRQDTLAVRHSPHFLYQTLMISHANDECRPNTRPCNINTSNEMDRRSKRNIHLVNPLYTLHIH